MPTVRHASDAMTSTKGKAAAQAVSQEPTQVPGESLAETKIKPLTALRLFEPRVAKDRLGSRC